MVATADGLASAAGVGLLQAGGNAADAAVAAAAVLAVTNPHLGDLGGDLWALVLPPGGGSKVSALCAAGRAGSGADALQMRCENLARVPPLGDIRAVTVPGVVDGWMALHDRFGTLPLDQVLEPAITYAAAGFPASPTLAFLADEVLHLPGADDLRVPAMAKRGHLSPGTVVRRPRVAATLTNVARSGRTAFYQGPFAEGLLELGGGLFQPDDLARDHAEWVEPLCIRAWDHDLWAPPPPSQAYLVLAGAAVADGLELPRDPADAGWAHLLVETARQVGRDRPAVLHDGADGAALLGPERLAACRAAVDPERAASVVSPRTGPGDTTALSVVDRDRMAVSLVQSNAGGFGAHIVEPATTVFLHNRGQGFSLEAGHPAELQAGRRPPHTLSPILVTRPDGSLRASLGTMGGDAQPQILLQLLAHTLRAGASTTTAVNAGRWILDDGGFTTWEGGGPDHVSVERDTPQAWRRGLSQRGHRVVPSPLHPDGRFGHAQVIGDDADGLQGAADPRSMAGAAIGY